MARKTYSEEFRRQAVELYETTPGATLRGIARDLGIQGGTLSDWVKRLGKGVTRDLEAPVVGKGESAGVRIARLEAELRAERVERKKLESERDILRQAARYFAGETRW
jgi:transposase